MQTCCLAYKVAICVPERVTWWGEFKLRMKRSSDESVEEEERAKRCTERHDAWDAACNEIGLGGATWQ